MAELTYATAKDVLAGRLTFGDDSQIKARQVVSTYCRLCELRRRSDNVTIGLVFPSWMKPAEEMTLEELEYAADWLEDLNG